MGRYRVTLAMTLALGLLAAMTHAGATEPGPTDMTAIVAGSCVISAGSGCVVP